MNINRNNCEDFFLLYLDRELSGAEMQEVEKFLNENTDLQKEFSLLQSTILFPANIVFEQKDLLLHKAEKRRIIPFYWTRIAAAIALLITGSWLIVALVKNHAAINARNEKIFAANDSRKKGSVIRKPDSGNNKTPDQGVVSQNTEQADHSKEKEFSDNKVQQHLPSEKNGFNPSVVSNDLVNNNNGLKDTDETVPVLQKTGIPDLQASETGTGNDPKPISMVTDIKPSTLSIAANPDINNNIKNEKSGEPDDQTDNAISVLALNERNKSITGFFKKLTKRTPPDENARKVRVSVFQFSY